MKKRISLCLAAAMSVLTTNAYLTAAHLYFDKQGGSGGTSSVWSSEYPDYGGYPDIDLPTRTGYTFNGYWTGVGGSGTIFYFGRTCMRSWMHENIDSMTLYAYWTANEYTVTFDKRGGSGGTSSVTATYDSAMPSIKIPTRSGFTFGGYYLIGKHGNEILYYTSTGKSAFRWDVPSNATLYAKWIETHVVTLDLQGGVGGTLSVMAMYGGNMPSIIIPTRTGYGFGGYWTGVSGGGIQYYSLFGEGVRKWDGSGATTLYAKWVSPSSVSLDQQGGIGGASSVTASYGSAMPPITMPTRTGYTFGGYFSLTGGDGVQYYTDSGDSAQIWDRESATTLYAKWWCNLILDQRGGLAVRQM